MTGLECPLPVTPKLTDSRVRVSSLLYELCNFRDAAANVRQLEEVIAAPSDGVRPLLEAAGLIATSELGSVKATGDGASRSAPRIQKPASVEPEPERMLFSWLHLSDLHFGHHDASHRRDQQLVLDGLLRDTRPASSSWC